VNAQLTTDVLRDPHQLCTAERSPQALLVKVPPGLEAKVEREHSENSAKHYPSPKEVVELLEDGRIAIQICGTGEGQVSDRLRKGIKRSA
jgi:hypothetical protein